ncbi:uncharacterized protein [Littorina saxatilis]|uniref:Secreted protein n=1 Tax=Littorina saxatilis TaxID=31220 RepID=A0AAN9G9J6_9CAEN
MKCVVIFAIVAAWVSSSEAVTCNDISTCTPDVSQFGDSGNKEDIQKACKSVREAMQCFRDAMADCRKGGNIPEETIRTLETQMDNYEQMLQNSCGSDSGAEGLKMTAFTLLSTFLALIL